jgi:intracellular sulfur oxidation DsrE/DsrF family protein
MKKIIILLLAFFLAEGLSAQTKSESLTPKKESVPAIHKIVFQLTSNDTLVHKSLMKQLTNITTVAPGSKLLVVCHGPGLSILIQEKTLVQDKIKVLKEQNVQFVACEFSMSEKKIGKDKIIPEAGFVPYGLIELVEKQEQGWSYIRLGF